MKYFNNPKEGPDQTKKDQTISKLDTRELIKLLKTSTPDSEQEKRVINAIKYRIEENKNIPGPLLAKAKKYREVYNKRMRYNENLNEKESTELQEYQKILEKDRKRESLSDDEKKILGFYDLNEMVHKTSGSGKTPMAAYHTLITAAAKYGHSKVVDLLVNEGGVNIDSTRSKGYSIESVTKSAIDYLDSYYTKLFPLGFFASVKHGIASAIGSIMSSKKPSETVEKSSANIAKDLVNKSAVRLARANSAPASLGRDLVEDKSQSQSQRNRISRSAPEGLIADASSITYESFRRQVNSNAVGVKKSGWFNRGH